MVCLGFVILLEGIINLSSDGLRGCEQRASLFACNSTPPAPDGETHRVFSELCWFAIPSCSPHCSLSYVGVTLRCPGGAGEHEIHAQPPTSSSPGDGSSMPVALPSSLSPAEEAAGRAPRDQGTCQAFWCCCGQSHAFAYHSDY